MIEQCPCDSKASYIGCCGLYHSGQIAPSALALMRSRYSAYVINNSLYLYQTWHVSTRSTHIEADEEAKWLGLRIKGSTLIDAHHAEVEFVARYKLAGKAYRLQERSRFVHEQGFWWYVDGDVIES